MNMVFQVPNDFMSIGMGQDSGLADVPEERFIRNDSAEFIFIFMPGIFIPDIDE
jgi:hypothetical protein